MANSTQPEKQEVTECVKVSETVASVPDLKTELLHHLVNVSSAFQQNNSGNAAAEELIKKNTGLVSELLTSSIVPAATNPVQAIVWKDLLMQKLLDAKMDLADETVKECVNQKVEESSKKIDKITGELLHFVSLASRASDKCEDTINFEFEPKKNSTESITHEAFLRGLIFSISLVQPYIDFVVTCNNLPVDKNCKATIRLTIKNQAGGQDSVRIFKKMFVGASDDSIAKYVAETNTATRLYVLNLIEKDEYEDESLSLVKDGKMKCEVLIRVDELTDKPENTTPIATTAEATIS